MSTVAWIATGCAVLAGGAFILLVLEAELIAHHQKPITTYTRTAVLRWPGRTFAIAGALLFILGMLFAHFFWDAGQL